MSQSLFRSWSLCRSTNGDYWSSFNNSAEYTGCICSSFCGVLVFESPVGSSRRCVFSHFSERKTKRHLGLSLLEKNLHEFKCLVFIVSLYCKKAYLDFTCYCEELYEELHLEKLYKSTEKPSVAECPSIGKAHGGWEWK